MLLITDITDNNARKIARAFLEATEGRAKEAVQSFDAGSQVMIGPVKQRARSASFNIAGLVDGKPAQLTVMIPHGMPECCVWACWCDELEMGGITVAADTNYRAIVDDAVERDEQWIEENEEYYLTCVRAGRWPQRL